jgi:beta-mannosidase
MVWQDLMFACAMYPANKDFLDLVGKELDEHLPRISSHPSVILINGNNEVDVAWKYWGFQKKYAISNQRQKEIEKVYDLLFKYFIAKKVEDYCWLPYTPTSPLGHWINKEDFPHGTQHYWGVWHGSDPIEDFSRKFGRFNAEYGFQSFPERKTLLTFSDSTQWNLSNPIMQHHQKSYVGNGMIKKHSDRLFGVASNFEEFVYFSQLTQAKGVGMAISSHRLNAPICMGTIYWQLNDCWPGPTWSSIDFFGNWKALQYTIRKDYEDVAMLRKESEAGNFDYFLISDVPDTFRCAVTCDIYTLSGVKIKSFQIAHTLNGNQHIKINATEKIGNVTDSNYVINFQWNNSRNEKKSSWYSVKMNVNHEFLLYSAGKLNYFYGK